VHLQVLRLGKRIAIAIAGGLVVILGVIMALPLVPGPGLAVIVLGLAILSMEFERPRIWLARLKARGVELKERLQAKRSQRRDG
jgi:hypothetical protein